MTQGIVALSNKLLEICRKLLSQSQDLQPYGEDCVLLLRDDILSLQQEVELVSTTFSGNLKSLAPDPQALSDGTPAIQAAMESAIMRLQEEIAEEVEKLKISNLSREFSDENRTSVKSIATKASVSRSTIAAAHKITWRTSNKSMAISFPHVPTNMPSDLVAILSAFENRPFDIQPDQLSQSSLTLATLVDVLADPDTQYTQQLKQEILSWMSKLDYNELVSAEQNLTRMLWTISIDSWQRDHLSWPDWPEADQAHYDSALSGLDRGLRDAMHRRTSSQYSVVFIGPEGAGKSTLLNCIIGTNVLPSGTGQMTAYPCRILHSPDLAEPELRLDVSYLMDRVAKIRRFGWTDKWSRYNAKEWAGEDLLYPIDLEDLAFSYSGLYSSVTNNLHRFESDSFTLSPFSRGVDDVRQTLNYVNDIVRFCRLFRIPFDVFHTADWATLSVNISLLKGTNITGTYEIYDLPGIQTDDNPFFWTELVREVIRRADSIICVISLETIDINHAWRLLPGIIDSGSNLAATCVILTKLDVAPKLVENDPLLVQISRIMWPGWQGGNVGTIKLCSVEMGMAAREFAWLVNASGTRKPRLSEIEGSSAAEVLDVILEGEDQEAAYEKIPLDGTSDGKEGLVQIAARLITKYGLRETLDYISGSLFEKGRSRLVVNEAIGVASNIKRLRKAIRNQLVRQGIIKQDLVHAIEMHEQLQRRAAQLRQDWADFCQNLGNISHQAESSVSIRIDSIIGHIISEKVDENNKIQDSSDIQFDSMSELLQFSLAAQNSLVSSLSQVENELAISFKEEIATAQQTGISSLQKKVGDFNSPDEELLGVLKTPDLNLSPASTVGSIQLPDDLARDHTISKSYKIPNPEYTFRATQVKILSSVAPASSRKPEDLSPLTRALLAAASFLPYLITRPFSRKISVNRYILDVEGMRTSLREIIARPWVDTLSKEVQAHLRAQNIKGRDIIDHAIATGLAASARGLHHPSDSPSTFLPNDTVCNILANYINMFASEMAFEYVADQLTSNLTPLDPQ
ncbi:hypothetical protein CPB86DRAFT_789248 [Serendipita vermifera]|nr:hypothetical protein CPB86DRAFT_789248 [Serendipita vermifera]